MVGESRKNHFPMTYEEKFFFDNSRRTRPLLQFGLAVKGQFSKELVEKSIKKIIETQPIIRTRFRNENGEVIRETLSPEEFPVCFLDLSGKDEKEVLSTFVGQMNQDLFPIHLLGSLIKISTFHFTKESCFILITTDHIVFDWWSYEIFLREFISFYEILKKGGDTEGLAIDFDLEKYIEKQRLMVDNHYENSFLYWEKMLSEPPQLLEVPTDRPRSNETLFEMQSVSLSIDKDIYSKIRLRCKKSRVTLYVVLLAAINVMYSLMTKQREIAIVCPVANRPGKELERLLGCFINLIIIKNHVDTQETFEDFLTKVRDVAFEAYDHQQIPAQLLGRNLERKGKFISSSLFQIILDLNTQYYSVKTEDFEITQCLHEQVFLTENKAGPSFDFTWSLYDYETHLDGKLLYNGALFNEGSAKKFASYYVNLLRVLLDNAEKPISELGKLVDF